MTKTELIEKLQTLVDGDLEEAHIEADLLLIDYINDPDIKKAYDAIRKVYA
jgi:hypothetical protein